MAAENTVEEKKGRRRKKDDSETTSVVEGKGRVTPGRRNAEVETTSGNFLTRPFMGMFEYFKDVRGELRKVTWPTTQDVRRLTGIVLIVTILSALAFGLIRMVFDQLILFGLNNPIVFLVVGILAVAGAYTLTRNNGVRNRGY